MKKLNPGCGDKILPGYINVDVAESRRGLKPDVLCDRVPGEATNRYILLIDPSLLYRLHALNHVRRFDHLTP